MKRKLSKQGPSLFAIGLGCASLGGSFYGLDGSIQGYGPMKEDSALNIVKTALEQGINFLNCADIFGGGEAEKRIGKVIATGDYDVYIGTSFGLIFDTNTATIKSIIDHPDYVREATIASLKRFGLSHLDLIQLQVPKLHESLIHEIFDSCNDLVQEGLISGFGWVTNDFNLASSVPHVKNPNFLGIQYTYNLVDRQLKMKEYLDSIEKGHIINGVLKNGILTGKYLNSYRPDNNHVISRFNFENEEYKRYFNFLRLIKPLIEDADYSLTEFAIGWLLQTHTTAIPIIGAKSVDQIHLNLSVIDKGLPNSKLINEIESIYFENIN
ncbi:MAG: aldo/keto reductase [Candidatus Heimdallarchaeota archaeon]|nr:aldo/keto reductase [Candidatus Heimdallarchaeota archaeon]MDH5646761.1 aldo/keto reductase [Candidatus Heimdallarchaeota archaeon]